MKGKHLLLILPVLFFGATFSSLAQLNFQSRGVGGGGALFSPAINPGNDNEYYVACDMTELFHSTDYGNSYSQVHFSELTSTTPVSVCFTSTPGLLYSINSSHDVWYPNKSTDGGVTWTDLPSPESGDQLYGIWADYANPQRVVLSGYCGIYFSSNGGASFTSVYTCADNNAGAFVGGVFFDGNNIYIGTNDGLLKSTNAGTSFTSMNYTGITAGQVIVAMAGAKQSGTVRLFCVTANSGDVYNYVPPYDFANFGKGIYSLDATAGSPVWTNKKGSIDLNTQYITGVAMATNDISTVYVSGSDNNTSAPVIYKSTNAGTAWTSVFQVASNANIASGWSGDGGDRGWSYGEVVFDIAVAPNNANKVIFTDFGYVHKTSDGGATWQQAYLNSADQNPSGAQTPKGKAYRGIGIENTTCWQVHWIDANNMFACFSDIKGIRSTDAGSSWSFNYNSGFGANSTYRMLQHPTNGTLYAATSNVHDMYQSTRLKDNPLDNADGFGRVIYSTDQGTTWQDIYNFQHPVFWIAMDPNNSNRMAASVIHSTQGGIYVTTNLNLGAGATWTKLTNPPRTEGHPATVIILNDGKILCTYSGHIVSSFTASSGVFLYNPATSSWSDVSDPGMQYWTKDIVIDPTDPTQNTWYVAVFSGWGGAANGKGGLYRTTNRGANWTKINIQDRVTSITFNPNTAGEAYMTTEQEGLWKSGNIHAANPTFTLVTEYPFRQPERVYFNPFKPTEMWVTSFGNGMKVASLAACTYAIQAPTATFTSSASNGSFTLTTDATCTWAASSSCTFVTVQNASGTGSATVSYTVAANTGSSSRTCAVTVNGQTHTITQNGASSVPVRYVTQSGAGAMNGSSWANAYPAASLQIAINGSVIGNEVWVACGTYKPTTGTDRTISITLKSGIAVYGGFQGTETSLTQRTLNCGSCSVLSGDIGATGTFTDNSYHVVYSKNVDTTAIMDGFVVRDGYDNRPATNGNDGLGGGILNDGANSANFASPLIRNCIVRDNYAAFGGGIFNNGSLGGNSCPIIFNCIVTKNNALDGGGGIDNFGLGGTASPTLVNTIVYDNSAPTAGGMYCWGGNPGGNSSPLLINCAFVNNKATGGNAGGLIADNNDSGGANNSGTSNPTLRNSIFWGNTATGSGPQFSIKGTGSFRATYSDVDLSGQSSPHVLTDLGGNINTNPLFQNIANAIGADNCWLSADDGLRLTGSSPCINTGSNGLRIPSEDITRGPRVLNSTVDMGPYENVASACTYVVQPPSATFNSSAGSGTLSVSTGATCTWTASSSCTFVTVQNANGSGNATVSYTVATNSSSSSRTCAITVNGQTHTITQSGTSPTCTYVITPPSRTFTSSAGSGTITLSTSPTCTWSAVSSCTFVTVQNASGTGTATVSYTVAVNSSPNTRTCTVTVGGQVHTITQSGTTPTCTYVITPPSNTFNSSASSGTVTLSTSPTCTWTAVSSCSFVTVQNASGTGTATVSYTVAVNNSPNTRTCTITIGGQTHTVTQNGTTSTCTYVITPPSRTFNSSASSGTVTLSTPPTCTWSATSSCSFVTIQNASGTGTATVSYTIAVNSSPNTRTCAVTVGGQTHTITQTGTSATCTYSIQPPSATFNSNANSGSISVNTGSTCTWTATSSCGFVTVQNNSGTGSGTVTYTISANGSSSTRTCAVSINGQTHTITQSGTTPSCTYVITPPSRTFTSSAGSGTVTLSTAPTCTWSAVSSCSFVTVQNTSGTGTATVSYTVAANTSSSTRTCAVIIGGQTHTIVQAGTGVTCTYTVQPPGATFASTGGSGNLSVSTASTCTWSAVSSCSFVTVQNSSGTGNATVSYTVSTNSSTSSRSCVITVNGQTHTITQSGASTCNYLIQPPSATFASGGGSSTFGLSTGATCTWTATASCSFVTIQNGSGAGNTVVSYTVSANTSSSTRTCVISANGQTHTITQSGASVTCIYAIQPSSATFNSVGGSGNVVLTTNNPTCTWTAQSTCSFVSVTNSIGTGPATINYTVANNPTSATRSCDILVNGQIHTITQSGSTPTCSYAIQPPSMTFSANAAGSTISVNTAPTCTWAATASCSFVTIQNTSGTGSGTVSYTVSANTGSSMRTCAISVNGQIHTITQAGVSSPCTPVVQPPSATLGSNGGNGSFSLSLSPTCTWTATSTCSFVTVQNGGGTGSATISYTVTPNTGLNTRTCSINVNGQVHTITQTGVTTCTYVASPATASYTNTAAQGGFVVNTSTTCSWTAVSNCSFVTMQNANGAGTGTITYTVSANTTVNDRTCTITVDGQTHTITQKGINNAISPLNTSLQTLEVFPNPASESCFVKAEKGDIVNVVNLLGQNIKQIKANTTLSLEGMAQGIYYLRSEKHPQQVCKLLVN